MSAIAPASSGPWRRATNPEGDPLTPLWRGAAVFRVLSLGFALGVQVAFSPDYARPALSWVLAGVMVAWTVLSIAVFARPAGRRTRWVVIDAVVTVALLVSTLAVQTPAQIADPTPTITTLWTVNPVITTAVLCGSRWGTGLGLAVAAVSIAVNGKVTASIARDAVILVLVGLVLGVVGETARRSQAALERALRTRAVLAERERLARAVHDSVLQVLAYVRREGAVLGGPAAELARLAGDQEVALRALVSAAPDAAAEPTAEVDLRTMLQARASGTVSVSVPATPVLLTAAVAEELAAVVRTALSNTAMHAGDGARSWVLVEDLGEEVVLTVRDDGTGIAVGRLDEAEAQGRLGVARSIRGRVGELGGTVALETGPGMGTEWEVRVARAPAPRRTARQQRG